MGVRYENVVDLRFRQGICFFAYFFKSLLYKLIGNAVIFHFKFSLCYSALSSNITVL